MSAETIIARIESALEKARWRKLELRGLYLDRDDYADFAHAETLRYQQETGSTAILWPCSYENVLLLNRKLIPVKASGRSAAYSTTGEEIVVPKRLSPRTVAA
jgi:hypothetical protein